MNNPNNIFKYNNEEDPIEECLTLQEYILDLQKIISQLHALTKYSLPRFIHESDCDILIDECNEILKEMSCGYWGLINYKAEE